VIQRPDTSPTSVNRMFSIISKELRIELKLPKSDKKANRRVTGTTTV